jgi:hypothetical protein
MGLTLSQKLLINNYQKNRETTVDQIKEANKKSNPEVVLKRRAAEERAEARKQLDEWGIG